MQISDPSGRAALEQLYQEHPETKELGVRKLHRELNKTPGFIVTDHMVGTGRSKFPHGCGTCFGDPECQQQAVALCWVCEHRGLCEKHLDRQLGGSTYCLECPVCRPHKLKGGAGEDEEEANEEIEAIPKDWEPFVTDYPPVNTPKEIEAADDRDWDALSEKLKPLVDKGILTMRQFFAPDEPGYDTRNPADKLEHQYICKLPTKQELYGKTLLLVSETSTRKSFRLREQIKEQFTGMNIIFVSCRCSHANDAYTQLKDLGFAVYNKDQNGGQQVSVDDTTRMIVQVRLCKLKDECHNLFWGMYHKLPPKLLFVYHAC